jgi:type III pantothenate kinase
MKLILDLGNTQTKIAFFEREKVLAIKKYSQLSLKELQRILKNNKDISSCIISSVTEYPKGIIKFLKSEMKCIELSSKTPVPVKNLYKTPKTLGYDRLASVAGARKLFPGKNILVIDAGTCIKYDFISSNNEYLGGGISPGITMRFRSLNSFTDRLPLLKKEKFKKLIGRSTKESILSGVENGVLAEVEGIIARYKKLYPRLKIILSGGDFSFFDNQLKNSIFVAPNLVLQGLNEILDYNLKSGNGK